MRASWVRALWGCAVMMLVGAVAVAPSASATTEQSFLALAVQWQETQAW